MGYENLPCFLCQPMLHFTRNRLFSFPICLVYFKFTISQHVSLNIRAI
uniref:Uncharacterized protein n=1 Tax=Anguilla anguilla TaxID=7936 RepID=A0A0E9QE29_ANGAN